MIETENLRRHGGCQERLFSGFQHTKIKATG